MQILLFLRFLLHTYIENSSLKIILDACLGFGINTTTAYDMKIN